MRSRRPAHDEISAIARRRLEIITAELAGTPSPTAGDRAAPGGAPSGVGAEVAARAPAPEGARAGEPVDVGVPCYVRPARGRHARRPLSTSGRAAGWVHDRLPPTVQGRVRLGAGHLRVVALLVACAFAVTAWWVVRADGPETVVPAATWSDAAAKNRPSAEPLVTPAAESSPTAIAGAAGVAGVVVVDVEGKVRRPGIVTLPTGSGSSTRSRRPEERGQVSISRR